ncbi:helix-turn-helix domain-containing protein [Nocardia fluminea]|uniref:helix-turn-helix domain-containing protein n=1 Tax=Nocardia fluminea TaxID=134984 RepID=UPI003D0F3A66
MRRAIVVMASAQHQPVGLIAKLMQVSEPCARQVIHDFNTHGFEALDPKWSGGRPGVDSSVVHPSRREMVFNLSFELGWAASTPGWAIILSRRAPRFSRGDPSLNSPSCATKNTCALGHGAGPRSGLLGRPEQLPSCRDSRNHREFTG